MRLYREFTTQEELDREYNPSTTAADAAAVMAAWQVRSATVRTTLPGALDVRYGPTVAEHLDIFPAGPGAPVHLFIHGGYWRRFAAADFSFVAEGLVRQGLTAVIVNYALCPSVTLTEIVRQVRAATYWTCKEIHRWGGDAAKLTVSGHSAGGHLAAMLLATDWAGEYGLQAEPIKGCLPISGLFDLAPFPYTYLQPALQLGWAEVQRLSPILRPASARCPVVAAVGGAESGEFKRQSRDYVRHLGSVGLDARLLELDDADHFGVLAGFDDPSSPLGRALCDLAGRA